MADSDYTLTVPLNDDRQEKLRALVADGPHSGHGAISETVRDLIDDEFDRRDIDLDGDTGEESTDDDPGIVETYDPDGYDGILGKDEIDELLAAGVEEINPEHVDRHVEDVPQGSAIPLATAATRFSYSAAGRDDVREVCIEMGLDTGYYLDGNSNHLNVPVKVVKRLGSADQYHDDVSTVDDDEIVEAGVKGALALESAFDPYDTSLDYEQLREDWKDVREYATDEYWLDGITADVIQSALFELKKETADISTEDSVQRTLNEWPHEPEALVEWYVEEESPGWDDGVKSHVVDQLEEWV